jgi:hypothetical protein
MKQSTTNSKILRSHPEEKYRQKPSSRTHVLAGNESMSSPSFGLGWPFTDTLFRELGKNPVMSGLWFLEVMQAGRSAERFAPCLRRAEFNLKRLSK